MPACKTGLIILSVLLFSGLRVHSDDHHTPKWSTQALNVDANEGIAIGDLNNDGLLDIVAGRNWYAAPAFTPRPLRTIEDWNGYVQSNGDFLFDVNGDGLLDVVAGSFIPSQICWYQNPGPEGWRLGHLWKRNVWIDTGRSENEAQLFADLDGDGVPEWIVNSWNQNNPVMVWRVQRRETPDEHGAIYELLPAVIAETGSRHGMGIGDLNGDGRMDILTGSGWYEQPNDRPWEQPWKFHKQWSIDSSIPMLVQDLDGDGRNDILVGKGHDYGLYWWRQLASMDGSVSFEEILIDRSYSQPHALALADLTGDGNLELITGKRYYAHNGGDPGGQEPPIIVFYTFDRELKTFTNTVIEEGHVGIGLQIATGDLNNDGNVDIAVAGKSGTYILWNSGGSKNDH